MAKKAGITEAEMCRALNAAKKCEIGIAGCELVVRKIAAGASETRFRVLFEGGIDAMAAAGDDSPGQTEPLPWPENES